MKLFFYRVLQCTWGALQTLAGLFVFFAYRRCRRFWYHGAVITLWNKKSSVSLGLFVFVAEYPNFVKKYEGKFDAPELCRRLLVHEYGHTVQSLILGPAYLIIIGIPSAMWAQFGREKRKREQIPYGAFFTEKWANTLGEWVTGEKSIENLML